jgi:hypothetical protein
MPVSATTTFCALGKPRVSEPPLARDDAASVRCEARVKLQRPGALLESYIRFHHTDVLALRCITDKCIASIAVLRQVQHQVLLLHDLLNVHCFMVMFTDECASPEQYHVLMCSPTLQPSSSTLT